MINLDDLFVLPNCETKKFTDVYESVNDFIYDYNNLALPRTISVDNAIILYYLLYAKYGNNNITNLDENQFKYKLFSTIWKYGPTWEKRLEIQENLRAFNTDFSDPDDPTKSKALLEGAKAIYNHAYNPSTEPSTQSLEELTYINDQNTTNYKKSVMDAYTQLWGLLATDVTEGFLDKFSPLFKKFISPFTKLYVEEE